MSGSLWVESTGDDTDFNSNSAESRSDTLERLYRENQDVLRSFLVGCIGYHHDVEDVIHEVFLRLTRVDNLAKRFPPGGETNAAYLLSVAHNFVVDLERRKAKVRVNLERHQQEERAFLCVDPGPEKSALADQQLNRVKRAILTMKPTWRKAFVLNRFKHKTYREISREMGVSVKQVENYMSSALQVVKRAAASEYRGVSSRGKRHG